MNREVGLIGLSRLVEELGLRVPALAVRSEAVRGGRRTRISGEGMVFPISAVMLRNLAKYEKALTAFSGKIGPFAEYRMDEAQRMTVLNETKSLYQYFDATPQSEYLYECVAETIEKDLREEIGFIERYDRALGETKEIVDMPDRRAWLLVRLILQNGGRLAKNQRDLFSEVTDEELAKIEKAISIVVE
jgi:hypothetical protein